MSNNERLNTYRASSRKEQIAYVVVMVFAALIGRWSQVEPNHFLRYLMQTCAGCGVFVGAFLGYHTALARHAIALLVIDPYASPAELMEQRPMRTAVGALAGVTLYAILFWFSMI